MAKNINALQESLNLIQLNNPDLKDEKEIVDIMTFCNGKRYLDLPGTNFHLYVGQRVILKSFYMGSRGNEDLKFTREELEWITNIPEKIQDPDVSLVYETNIKDVIRKLKDREKKHFYFNELNLVLGRRASKTIMASIISAYEVYKLLFINGGDPHSFYNLPFDSEILILNVALSREQAGKLFAEVCNRLRHAPIFNGRISKDTNMEIRLYTDRDLESLRSNSNIGVDGAISIKCGSSNIDAMRGSSAILILFDELAFFDDTGLVSGRKLYDALKPSLAKFHKKGDGRLVEISSPYTRSGIFYERHKVSFDNEKGQRVLSWQLPTWLINDDIDFNGEDLRAERLDNPDSFAVEFGAQWSATGLSTNFFPEGLLERCFRGDLGPHEGPRKGMNYYLHVDPANGGDRYVAVLIARETYTNDFGEKRKRAYLANIYSWDPEPGVGLSYMRINQEVLRICRKYYVISVTYDQWNSIESIQFLRANGIRCYQTSFNNSYKNKIYFSLKDMMAYHPQPEILLYYDQRMFLELKHLKCRETKRGLTFFPDKHGPVTTDDLVDCLAGSLAEATGKIRPPMPRPVTVNTGIR